MRRRVQSKGRVQVYRVVRQLRGEGVEVPPNAGYGVIRELGIGRYLRSPHLGWVLTDGESVALADELRRRYGK